MIAFAVAALLTGAYGGMSIASYPTAQACAAFYVCGMFTLLAVQHAYRWARRRRWERDG